MIINNKSNQLSASKYASKQKRLLNYLVDLILCQFFAYVITIITIATMTIFGYFERLEQDLNLIVSQLSELLIFMFTPIYFILFESISGKTPAKYLTKTKVVDMYGEKPSFWKIVVRSYTRLLPYEILTFILQNKLGLHDKVSGTRVMDIRNHITK